MQKFLIATLLCSGCAVQTAQAGILEDLLAVPAIQALLGRSSELPTIARKCENVQFRTANNTFCQQARQAELLTKMPPQLRMLMAHAPSAQSLRQLCIGAIGTPTQGSYLCAELAKSDSVFQAQAQTQSQAEIWNRQMR
ncbi:MAG: hypothetical protein ABI434_01315 [Burkholderiaceae bacterium]